MLAKNLEHVLLELCSKDDVSHAAPERMERRFTALRQYGRLPRGRSERTRPLTNAQIALAILGLATSEPGWAGHAATILASLQPVGGPEAGFAKATTLVGVIEAILGDTSVRKSLVSVRLSTAEAGINSNGYCQIVSLDGSGRKTCSYVSRLALSVTGPGGDQGFDHDRRHATASRELVLSRAFFDRLAKRIALIRSLPPQTGGDGAEYDAEEAEQARLARLGATQHSRYLTVGVDNQVTWPKAETLIAFGDHKLVLMPKTKEHVQSISIDLHANKLTVDAALTVINRMLSLMAWCDDQYAIAQSGWSGSSVPQPVRKRDLAFATAHEWIFSRTIPVSSEVQRALALYREARNAEQNFMVSYAVLNYYKIIEIRHHGFAASSAWVAQVLPDVLADPNDQTGVHEFLLACGSEAPELYIYAACRVAVAHASPNRVSDPDEATEIRRLHVAADIMRRLARRFISDELGVSECPLAS